MKFFSTAQCGQATLETLVVWPSLALLVLALFGFWLAAFTKINVEYALHEFLVCQASESISIEGPKCKETLDATISRLPGRPQLLHFRYTKNETSISASFELAFAALGSSFHFTEKFARDISLPLSVSASGAL